MVSGSKINVSFGKRLLFQDVELEVPTGSKTALIGGNGSGKTTLAKMIIEGNELIRTAKGAKIGYFSQNLDLLDEEKTVLENAMRNSIQKEWVVRTVLARLLFKGDEVYKSARVLSGGEKVKLTIAMLILSDANFLVLDEPTNYLDLLSMEALQELLSEYTGTVLFISHDRRFVCDVADRILFIQDNKLMNFESGYEEYLEFLNKKDLRKVEPQQDEVILRMRLAELAAKLSAPGKASDYEALDKEYKEVAEKLGSIKR